MQERKSKQEAAEGQFALRAEALRYVSCASTTTAEQHALLEVALKTSGDAAAEQDLDELEAENELCMFLSPMWPGTDARDLLRVEWKALHLARVMPTRDELSDLGMTRELIHHIQAYVAAQEADMAALAKKNVNRRKDKSGRAEEKLLSFLMCWSEVIVKAMRTTEKRAAYLQTDQHTDEDLAALLMFRELIDRVEGYIYEFEHGEANPHRNHRHGHRSEPSTSAN